MTPEPKALPCPFCGKPPAEVRKKEFVALDCDPCGVTVAEDCYVLAVLKWNRRAPDPEKLRMREALEYFAETDFDSHQIPRHTDGTGLSIAMEALGISIPERNRIPRPWSKKALAPAKEGN